MTASSTAVSSQFFLASPGASIHDNALQDIATVHLPLRGHYSDGYQAGHALTFKLAHSMGADHYNHLQEID